MMLPKHMLYCKLCIQHNILNYLMLLLLLLLQYKHYNLQHHMEQQRDLYLQCLSMKHKLYQQQRIQLRMLCM